MENKQKQKKVVKHKKFKWIIAFEFLILFLLIGAVLLYQMKGNDQGLKEDNKAGQENQDIEEKDKELEKLTTQEREALKEQERLQKEAKEREDLIIQADKLTLSYDYDGAIELIQSYQGSEGGYEIYPILVSAIERYKKEKESLVLYGGSYTSVTQINHIFFHSLIADNSKAFDSDYDSVGYNMYMTTVTEFKNMMQKMYEDGYVLVSMYDVAEQVTLEDGTTKFVPGKIYLPEGKKPFVLSQDDVNYYDYMDGDGFASRIVLDENGKPTCEMILEDGSRVTGPFDIVPILDAFVEEHPDFSYKGAKGTLAITGYEGALGYRTDDPTSPTYEEDKEMVRKVAEALKANGWDFASHSWGHKNMQAASMTLFKNDTDRWMEEVGSLLGPTDIYIFPFGIDIETTIGEYSSEKYHYLKEKGFNYFCGVFKDPWMHIKDNYVRMTRRPLDGQAMLEFPERLADLFDVPSIIDPERPAKNW
ncbi:MAG: polysaccharide deacetylase [Clostridiales bacterium]|nr:polysaccharide deacetylase [Clostridiales bacterium]